MTEPSTGTVAAANRETATLGDPITLPCGHTLRNRIAKPSMAEAMGGRHGRPGERLTNLYTRWAGSGAGLLLTGNVMIDRRSLGEPGDVVIEDDRDLEALSAWAAAAKSGGASAIVQLNHPGRQTLASVSKEVVAPSAVRPRVKGARFPKPRELTGDEIEQIVQRFATAAEICVRAGFDGVQIHGAHGYLVSQFLSPLANLRTDQWGGDPERRRRFLIEVVRATRAAIGPDRILSVKLNSADFQRGGFSEQESIDAIRALEGESVDLLEISGGTYSSAAMVGASKAAAKDAGKASTRAREAYFMAFAERARKEVSMPLMITGGLRSAAAMNEALAAGIDLIGVARPLTLEPDLPKRLIADPTTASQLHRVRTGLSFLDGAAEIVWHNRQMRRMARGLDPDPQIDGKLGLVRTLLRGRVIPRRRRGG
ncbi:MAG: NADH:flavin oxidoreductase [Actinobacteria bacterium]|nr:NADH:flavin oxidoreductase [Actinomycetota bacterium]